jgi:septum formation protein
MPLWRAAQPLVLASRSAPRRAMLEAAGLPVEISLPDLDERAVEAAAGPLGPAEAARLLAREKARAWLELIGKNIDPKGHAAREKARR